MLENVPTMVTLEQNLELCRFPTLKEVKAVIFELSKDSANGLDGLLDYFIMNVGILFAMTYTIWWCCIA